MLLISLFVVVILLAPVTGEQHVVRCIMCPVCHNFRSYPGKRAKPYSATVTPIIQWMNLPLPPSQPRLFGPLGRGTTELT